MYIMFKNDLYTYLYSCIKVNLRLNYQQFDLIVFLFEMLP